MCVYEAFQLLLRVFQRYAHDTCGKYGHILPPIFPSSSQDILPSILLHAQTSLVYKKIRSIPLKAQVLLHEHLCLLPNPPLIKPREKKFKESTKSTTQRHSLECTIGGRILKHRYKYNTLYTFTSGNFASRSTKNQQKGVGHGCYLGHVDLDTT